VLAQECPLMFLSAQGYPLMFLSVQEYKWSWRSAYVQVFRMG
jgi:hypothetical protein